MQQDYETASIFYSTLNEASSQLMLWVKSLEQSTCIEQKNKNSTGDHLKTLPLDKITSLASSL